MGDASARDGAESTVLAAEAGRFGRLAGDWWDPRGRSAPLHRMNPARLRFIRSWVDERWGADPAGFRPLAGRTALDVGCGAGLLAEPLARLGAAVTGLDASPELVEAARAHAAGSGLSVEYRAGGVEAVEETFDLVTCLEVLEHVAEPAAFVRHLGRRLAPGGLLVLSTPNRTAWSRLLIVELAERTGRLPRGTHDWGRFLTPAELTGLLAAAGLRALEVRGLELSPTRGFRLGGSTALDYLVAATHA